MDFFGVQLLVGIILTVLIVFPGTVSPAHKQLLDTVVGRLIAILAVIGATHMGGWPVGILAAVAILVLTPNTMREGFRVSEVSEGFNGANKIQEIPKERRDRWFIERVMHEKPKSIETDVAITQAIK
jgi:hypothetical protein